MQIYECHTHCSICSSRVGMPLLVRDAPASDDVYEVDESRIQLNIEAGDYFARISTLLGFLEESIELCNPTEALEHAQLKAIRAARKDLEYLGRGYRIVPKKAEG